MSVLTPEALDAIEAEELLQAKVWNAIAEVLEARLEDDIHLDLNDCQDAARFHNMLDAVVAAAFEPVTPELRRLRTENEEQGQRIAAALNYCRYTENAKWALTRVRAALTGEATE